MSKTVSSKFFGAAALVFSLAVLSNSAMSGPFGLPDKFVSMLDKKWVFTKCVWKDKDCTDMVIKKNKGNPEFYIFKSDGTMETNLLDVISGTWEYKEDQFFMRMKKKVDPASANVAGADTLFSQYSIGEVTKTTLTFEVKSMKIVATYTAK